MAPSCRAALSVNEGWTSPTTANTGFHPLLISLANTGEPLFLFNQERQPPLARAGRCLLGQKRSRFAARLASAKILLRGDTKFAQTRHLDRWGRRGRHPFRLRIRGIRIPSRREPTSFRPRAYSLLKRPQRHPIKTTPREGSPGGLSKEEIVRQRGYETVPPARGDGRGVRNIGRSPVRKAIG